MRSPLNRARAAVCGAGVLLGLAGCESPPASPPPPAPTPAVDPQPPAPPAAEPHTGPRFEDLPGPAAVHHAGRHPQRWLPEVLSGSVSLLDVDRDGALDLLLLDSGSLGPEPAPDAGPKLWRGDGHGGFADVTEAYGLLGRGYAMGAAVGDVNGDGWVDLYLTTFDGQDRLLLNEAGTRFRDATAAWGLEPQGWSSGAAFFDADGDGDLDLYVVRYVAYTLDDAIDCWFHTVPVYCSPDLYAPLPDRFYRNEGGRFVDASESAGVTGIATKGLGITTGDFDGDGDTDLYIAGDRTQNRLLSNDGHGVFSEQAILAGAALSELGEVEGSRGVALTRGAEGWNIAVAQAQDEPTGLYVRGPSVYRERSDAVGIAAASRERSGFGVAWLDADNDGDQDLLVANGHVLDNVATFRSTATFAQTNSLFAQVAPGSFEEVSAEAGPSLQAEAVSRGLAVGDIDGDGGLDYVVANNDGPLQVARNVTSGRGHWVSLWLEPAARRSAIGTTVTLGDQVHEVRGATSYLSVSDTRVHLGLGAQDTPPTIEVRWPDGAVQSVGLPKVDTHYRLVQGQTAALYVPGASSHPPETAAPPVE